MAVSHVKSNTVAGWTGTVTVFNSQGSSGTAAASDMVLPADWNSAHHNLLTLTGNTAGASTVSGTNIILAGGNNITLSAAQGANVATISVVGTLGLTTAALSDHSHGNPTLALTNLSGTTASNSAGFTLSLSAGAGGAGDGVNIIAAGTQTANTTGSVLFNNANGITFGMSNSSVVTASHNALTSQSNQAFSADASSTFQTLSFQDSNGVSFSNNAGALRVTHALQFTSATSAITSNALHSSASRVINIVAATNNAAGGTASLSSNVSFSAANGLTFYTSAGNAIVGSYTVPTVTNSSMTVSDAATSGTLARLAFTNLNGITLSLSTGAGGSHTIVGSYTVPTQTNQTLGLYAVGNTTGQSSSSTFDARTISFVGQGIASVGFSAGSVNISVPAGGGGITNVNISAGTTSQNLSNFVFSNSNGVSFGLNGSTITASAAAGAGGATISSYENMRGGMWGSSAVTFGATSLSSAVAFEMPMAGSFSFIRIPVLMTMGSTTIATIASATATAQMGISSTFNAVVYSVGSGASSKSLMSVASGQGTVNLSGRISISNSTQGSYTLAYSGLAEGGGTTLTTQYSISNTNYSFSSQPMSEFSSNRWLDIPFASSLPAGLYWLIIGRSTSTSSAGVALSAMTNWGPRYSNHYAATQHNLLFGVMGSTNMTSIGALVGAGVFSTAGGGTTSGLPISAISSTASNPRMYFQMLRSA